MRACRLRTAVRILTSLVFCAPAAASAQTYEVVHPFLVSGGAPQADLLQTSDGKIYGVSTTGGDFFDGSVFVLTPDVGTYDFTEIHAFSGPDGRIPTGALVEGANGVLYGTTSLGGALGLGNVFMVDKSGRLTSLHEFTGTGDDGANPSGPLTLGTDGSLYGVAPFGGLEGNGCIYRVDAAGGVATIHSFTSAEGQGSAAGLVSGGDGFLYGVAEFGGDFNMGTVFRTDLSGTVSVIASLDGTNGSYPEARLVLASDGFFYGTTVASGDDDEGTIFRIAKTGGLTAVHSFAAGDGQSVGALLQASDGKIYGTRNGFGSGSGSVFRFDPVSQSFETVHAFAPEDGQHSFAGVVELPDGRLAGTLRDGGPDFESDGGVFAMDKDGTTVLLHGFAFAGASLPWAGLMEGSDVNLYGTTAGGGAIGFGTVFRCSFSGEFTDLHDFDGVSGYSGSGRLLRFDDGALYGVTDGFGGFGGGNVFKLDGQGLFTEIQSLPAGNAPEGGLVSASDGNLYGTTRGGSAGFGTVYRVTPGDVFETVHDFDVTDGANPEAALIFASDGNLYGTTVNSTGNSLGSVFRMNFAGDLTTIHIFQDGEGSDPDAELIEPVAGTLYGTTPGGGAHGGGTAFRIDFAGGLTTLHDFDESDGREPHAGLVQGADGAFYGSTVSGGVTGQGVLFKVASDGTFSKLHDFRFTDGSGPRGTLVFGSDGNFYGVASGGGAGVGVLFRLAMTPPTPTLESLAPSSGRAAGGTSIDVRGSHLRPDEVVTLGGVPTTGTIAVDMARLTTLSPALPPGTLNDVTVTSGDSSTATLPQAWFSDFLDVDSVHPFHDFVESIFRAGITAGCNPGLFCPDDVVTREQMAVFLLKSKYGNAYDPPDCIGVFTDVPCTPGVGFPDWIEQLYAEGITGGCVLDPLQYCPGRAVTRAEMAVFLLKTEHGTGYTPGPCGSLFADVPCPATPEFPFSDWIEQLYAEAITSGCALAPLRYCPDNPNTRGEMAVFLTKTFPP